MPPLQSHHSPLSKVTLPQQQGPPVPQQSPQLRENETYTRTGGNRGQVGGGHNEASVPSIALALFPAVSLVCAREGNLIASALGTGRSALTVCETTACHPMMRQFECLAWPHPVSPLR